jgi:hypothetical protein
MNRDEALVVFVVPHYQITIMRDSLLLWEVGPDGWLLLAACWGGGSGASMMALHRMGNRE